MTAGRPSLYKPEYCDLVKSLGKEGKSVVQMANACGVTKQSMYEWEKEHEDFSYAFSLARQYSQEWWESTGQENLVEMGDGKKINAGLYAKSMAARFPDDWRDNSVLKHEGGMSINVVSMIPSAPNSESST